MNTENRAAYPDVSQPASVSVVVPCYRCRTTISRAVESVAAQTLLPLEVILVDDCSGDGTLDALEELQRRYGAEWIRVMSLKKNMGAGNARNAGWDNAQGEFVAFLDADDSWHPRKIDIQYQFLRANPDVELCGHRSGKWESGQEHKEPGTEGHARLISPRKLLLSNRFITPSVMLRRQIKPRFDATRRYMEDHLLWMEIALAGATIACLEEVLCYTHKAAFGEHGLSADMWGMERAELDNYQLLGARGLISRPVATALQVYSLLKYVRRLLLKGFGRLPESV